MTFKLKPWSLRVAYLAGTFYCGSTFLAMLMDSHKEIASVGETSLRRSIRRKSKGGNYSCSCGKIVPQCPFWQQIFFEAEKQGFEFNSLSWANDYKYDGALLHKIFDRYSTKKLLRIFREVASTVLPVHRGRIHRVHRANVVFMQSVLKLTDANLFFDTSKDLMRLFFLLKIPNIDMKIIRIIRDVRAFANSSKRRGVSINESVKQWENYHFCADILARQLPSEKVFYLKYENLCQNPKYWLQNLCGFLEISSQAFPQTIIPKDHHVLGNPIRRKETLSIQLDESWKETLTKSEEDQIMSLAEKTNRRYGYVS